ncbi:MAG: HDOD domain-containing protein [Bryobacteraceae bacterium]
MSDLEQALKTLPPFKPVVLQLLKLTKVSDINLPELAALIEAEPALSAEILTLANSPLFNTAGQLRSIPHAITFLGVARIRSVVTTAAARTLVTKSRKTVVLRNCWLHSVATALIAAELAQASGQDRDAAYLAGLLHDIGRLGLLGVYPDRYTATLQHEYESIPRILAGENKAVGVDHCEAGLILTRLWNLPEEFANVAAYHHNPDPKLYTGSTGLVRLACLISDSLRFEAVRYRSVLRFDEIRTCMPKQIRVPSQFQMERIEEYVVENIASLDSL